MLKLSDVFVRRMHDVYGARGRSWIAQLPTLVAEYEQRWQLSCVTPLPELSYHFVANVALKNGSANLLYRI